MHYSPLLPVHISRRSIGNSLRHCRHGLAQRFASPCTRRKSFRRGHAHHVVERRHHGRLQKSTHKYSRRQPGVLSRSHRMAHCASRGQRHRYLRLDCTARRARHSRCRNLLRPASRAKFQRTEGRLPCRPLFHVRLHPAPSPPPATFACSSAVASLAPNASSAIYGACLSDFSSLPAPFSSVNKRYFRWLFAVQKYSGYWVSYLWP